MTQYGTRNETARNEQLQELVTRKTPGRSV